MRILKAGVAAMAAVIAIANVAAVTRVPSADGQYLGRPGHQSLGARQRRHRHRRPRQPVQRFWLSQAAGPPRRDDARHESVFERLRCCITTDSGDSIRPRRCSSKGFSCRGRDDVEGHAIPALSRYLHQFDDRENAMSRSRGAEPPARMTTAGRWRWRRRQTAIAASICRMRSSP